MKPAELREKLHGIVIISITPFLKDGSIDVKGFEKNLNYLVDHGLNKNNSTIVIGGSTGECGAMTIKERKELFNLSISILGDRLPVIAGCNSTNIKETIELANYAEDIGAAGVMALAPFYYPAKDDECIYAFYHELSKSTSLGILMYNNIEVMQIDLPIPLLKRLKKMENIVGLKDCTPNFYKMTRTVQEIGDTVSVVNGHGEFLEPFIALAGTTGYISSMANFAPQLTAEIYKNRSNGNYHEAIALRNKLVPYMDLAIEFSKKGGEYKVISLLKYMTDNVGSCGGYPRIPTIPLTKEEMKMADNVLTMLDN